MSDSLIFRFDVQGNDFTSAGQASVQVKKNLRQLGFDSEIIRRVSIAMYEGEINMVIHAGGGVAEVIVTEEYIEIVLEDKGPGIKEEEIKFLFNKFYQGDSSHKSEGNGLGLALVKRITDLYGGNIEVKNAQDCGAIFTVKLPFQAR